MSVFIVCAVFDSAVQAYGRPMFVPTRGAAVRSFTDEVNRKDENNPLYRHPDDFELRFLGEFEDSYGRFDKLQEGGQVLARAKDVRQD